MSSHTRSLIPNPQLWTGVPAPKKYTALFSERLASLNSQPPPPPSPRARPPSSPAGTQELILSTRPLLSQGLLWRMPARTHAQIYSTTLHTQTYKQTHPQHYADTWRSVRCCARVHAGSTLVTRTSHFHARCVVQSGKPSRPFTWPSLLALAGMTRARWVVLVSWRRVSLPLTWLSGALPRA